MRSYPKSTTAPRATGKGSLPSKKLAEASKVHGETAKRWLIKQIQRDQTIVEHFNRTLAERLFGYQYAVEMLLPEGQRSTAWVKRLPNVVAALNKEVTRLTGKKTCYRDQRQGCFSKTFHSLLKAC